MTVDLHVNGYYGIKLQVCLYSITPCSGSVSTDVKQDTW